MGSEPDAEEAEDDAADDVGGGDDEPLGVDGAVGFKLKGGEGGVSADEADGDGVAPGRGAGCAGVEDGDDEADGEAAGEIDDEGAQGETRRETVLHPLAEAVASQSAESATQRNPKIFHTFTLHCWMLMLA